MKKRSFLENTSYSSFILIATKLLGVIPVFFLDQLIGEKGLAAYAATYAIAVVALELAAGGIPLGVAQFVSKSNASGDYKTSMRAFRQMLIATATLSIVIGIFFFFFAPVLALSLPKDIQSMTVFSLRMFIPTIILAPVVGVVRGFYNGNKDTIPSATSQFVEQLVWIISLFIFVFLANVISRGNEGLRSGLAIFANFVAILSALYILYRYWRKHEQHWKMQIKTQTGHRNFTNNQILATILALAIPSVLAGFMMNSFQFFTNIFYNGALAGRYSSEMITYSFKTLQFNSAKFVSIPLVVANTIALATLPFMASAFRQKDMKGVRVQVKQSLLLSYTLVAFAAFAIWVFGPMLYHGLFFAGSGRVMEIHTMSARIIRIDGFRALFLGIATLTNVILVTINERWRSVKYTGVGVLVKVATTSLLLMIFGPIGDILSSILAYGVVAGLGFRCILRYVTFPKRFYRQFAIIFVVNMAVALLMYILIRVLGYHFTTTNRLLTMIEVIVIGLIGLIAYGYILLRLNIVKYIIGKKV